MVGTLSAVLSLFYAPIVRPPEIPTWNVKQWPGEAALAVIQRLRWFREFPARI